MPQVVALLCKPKSDLKGLHVGLTSDPHTYARPGRYRVLVKVVDIFGNDTSQAFDVEVS